MRRDRGHRRQATRAHPETDAAGSRGKHNGHGAGVQEAGQHQDRLVAVRHRQPALQQAQEPAGAHIAVRRDASVPGPREGNRRVRLY